MPTIIHNICHTIILILYNVVAKMLEVIRNYNNHNIAHNDIIDFRELNVLFRITIKKKIYLSLSCIIIL